MTLPGRWEENGLPSFDGTVWFRGVVTLPADWADTELEIRFGRIEDEDSTWIRELYCALLPPRCTIMVHSVNTLERARLRNPFTKSFGYKSLSGAGTASCLWVRNLHNIRPQLIKSSYHLENPQ